MALCQGILPLCQARLALATQALAAGRGLALGSASSAARAAAPARTYFVGPPVPTLNRDDVFALTDGKNNVSKAGRNRIGCRLTRDERDEWNKAKAQGYLAANNFTGQSLFNSHYTYCWSSRKPYIAIDKYGTSVFVDATPVQSLAKEARKEALSKLLASLGAAVAAPAVHRPSDRPLQVVAATSLRKQTGLTMPGPLEGSNAQKIADAGVGADTEVFTVHTSSRDQARRVAQGFYAAYCEAFAVPTPAALEAARAERVAAKQAEHRRSMLRKLRTLVADSDRVRMLRVAGGNPVEGFIRADKAGLIK